MNVSFSHLCKFYYVSMILIPFLFTFSIVHVTGVGGGVNLINWS